MSQTNYTTKQHYTHLSETERTTIEILLQEGYSQTDIASDLTVVNQPFQEKSNGALLYKEKT